MSVWKYYRRALEAERVGDVEGANKYRRLLAKAIEEVRK